MWRTFASLENSFHPTSSADEEVVIRLKAAEFVTSSVDAT
jgi:hypothetical protein